MISYLTANQDPTSISILKAQFDQTSERAYFEFMSADLTEDLNQDFKYMDAPIPVLAEAQDTANFIGAQFRVIPNASTLVAFEIKHSLTFDSNAACRGHHRNEYSNAAFWGLSKDFRWLELTLNDFGLYSIPNRAKKDR